MTTRSRPRAALGRRSSTTPSCIQTARAPISIASSTCAPATEARRKTSTTSTGSGTADSVGWQRSPRISVAIGLTGMTR